MNSHQESLYVLQNVIINESDFNKDGATSRSINCFDDNVISNEELVSLSTDDRTTNPSFREDRGVQ